MTTAVVVVLLAVLLTERELVRAATRARMQAAFLNVAIVPLLLVTLCLGAARVVEVLR